MDTLVARRLWTAGEPYHAVCYFDPACRAAWEQAGLRGFWRGYFACRAAPLGPVEAGVVTAAFYNFAPTMVERAIPAVWALAPPAQAWAARLEGVDRALRSALGDAVVDGTRAPAALARRAADACAPEGRALGAAYAALPWPGEPHLDLWQALTVLRESRGDGHNAALLAAGIDGCAAHVLAAAAGASTRSLTQPHRGWTDADWDGATERLRAGGVLDDRGRLTDGGRDLRAGIEATTDRLSLAPWRELGDRPAEALRRDLVALSGPLVEAGVVPVPNPMGAPWP